MENQNPNQPTQTNREIQARSLATSPLLRGLYDDYLADRLDDLCLADPAKVDELQRAAIAYQSTADFWSYLNEHLDRLANSGDGNPQRGGPTNQRTTPRATFNP